MYHISKSKVVFKVDEEKRTVRACISNPQIKTMAIDFVNEHFPSLVITNREFLNSLEMNSHYCATATCSVDDEWDVETGKLVAYNRLKNKICTYFFNRLQIATSVIEDWLDAYIEDCNSYGTLLEEQSNMRNEEIKSLIGE